MELNRDCARKCFDNMDLSYKNIERIDIRLLCNMVESEFIDYYMSDNHYAKLSNYKIKDLKSEDIKISEKDGLVHAYLKMSGSNFEERECISFNNDGFIGFAGWADDTNVQPILRAFIKWCTKLKEKQLYK